VSQAGYRLAVQYECRSKITVDFNIGWIIIFFVVLFKMLKLQPFSKKMKGKQKTKMHIPLAVVCMPTDLHF